MQSKLTHYFTNSVAALLGAFVSALFLSNIANFKFIQPHDPLFVIPMDICFWLLGLAAMAVAFACVLVSQPRFKLALILWSGTNLIIYRLGLQWQGVHSTHGYVGPLARTFNLPNGVTSDLLTVLFLYLFTGSAALLIWNFLANPEEVPAKTICDHCGGHIAFSPQNVGQKIPCPHCQEPVTLQAPNNLKMSCVLCGGHIEFPAHALGQKIQCPHCRSTITLLKQKPPTFEIRLKEEKGIS
jgi:DNA-directed RNA polymerase subunit RPC12/RpoP